MDGECPQFHVRRIPGDNRDHELALHVALDAEPPVGGTAAPQVADLLAAGRRHGRSLDLVFGAYADDRLESACAAVESLGAAAAFVHIPHDIRTETRAQATVVALSALRAAAWDRFIKLLEVLVEPDANEPARALRKAGFKYLTQLIYLERRSRRTEPSPPVGAGLNWVTYSPELAGLFCEALEATYLQSLDCPELTGLRSTPEVLAGHRATGVFDPSLWWVARRGDTPVGLLLLSRVPNRSALEIIYVGVAQPVRGTGVADALLTRAVAAARHVGATILTLAVDCRNIPARRMYRRWCFAPTGARDAWIASSPRT